MRKAERAVLVGIVIAIALAIRLGFVLTAVVQKPLRFDAGQYARYAHNLVEHGVYSLATTVPPPPDAFRSPGYPVFLAAMRWLGGASSWMSTVAIAQAVLGAATVLLTYRTARAVVGWLPAIAAAVLTALSPHLVASSAYVLSECAATFAVAVASFAFVHLHRDPRSNRSLALAALAAGICVLTNEALVAVPFAFGLASWRIDRRRAIAFVVVALLPLAAWTVRNQVQPLAKTGGDRVTASISHGSYPGMVLHDPKNFGFPYSEDPEQPAFGASWQKLGEVLARRVADEPWRYFVWYAIEKPLWLWSWPLVQGTDVYVYEVVDSPYENQLAMVATHRLMRWLHLPVMLLAALTAIALLLRRATPFGLRGLAALAVLGTLAYVPVIPDPRYLQPIRPLLFVLAASGAAFAWKWIAARRGRRSTTNEGAPQEPAAAT